MLADQESGEAPSAQEPIPFLAIFALSDIEVSREIPFISLLTGRELQVGFAHRSFLFRLSSSRINQELLPRTIQYISGQDHTSKQADTLSNNHLRRDMDAQQLAQVEALCEALYTGVPAKFDGGESISRQEAQQRLLSLQTDAKFIPQCQYILDNSKSQYACLVASNSLIELITIHWNSFTIQQRIDIRNYVLGYLANTGPNLQDYLVLSLIKIVCRITKLGWFDDSKHRELADDVQKFLQATVEHCILGLKILNQLVDELNIPTSGRTLTQHRKTSVSFRDVCLFKVFQLGMTSLKQLQSGTISKTEMRVVECLPLNSLSQYLILFLITLYCRC